VIADKTYIREQSGIG